TAPSSTLAPALDSPSSTCTFTCWVDAHSAGLRDKPEKYLNANFLLIEGNRTKAADRGPPRFATKAELLHRRLGVFRRPMAPQQLRKILRERRPGQNHVTSHFVRLLLQIALNVRQEPNN